MTSFNQFKNNCEILKKYLSKMNLISQCEIKPQWIDQKFLKQNNPHIFLQILHYILIKFSPFILFVKILDLYPTIKDDSDKKFLTNVINLARKMFQMEVKIDLQQFLSSKFVEKKTQFSSILCKLSYQLHIKQSKSSEKPFSNSNNLKSIQRQQQNQTNNTLKSGNRHQSDDDSQDQIPKSLNIAPLKGQNKTNQNNQLHDSESDEDLKQLLQKRKQIKTVKQKTKAEKQNPLNTMRIQVKKGNFFPKKVYQNQDDGDQQNDFTQQNNHIIIQQSKKNKQRHNLKFIQSNKKQPQQLQEKQPNKILQSHNYQNYEQKQNTKNQTNYVTRQQFMEIVGAMSQNFTQLLGKFNSFQAQVGGWVQNINAKISILQQNVKTIKNNL